MLWEVLRLQKRSYSTTRYSQCSFVKPERLPNGACTARALVDAYDILMEAETDKGVRICRPEIWVHSALIFGCIRYGSLRTENREVVAPVIVG